MPSFLLGAMHDKNAIEYSPKFLRFLNALPEDQVVLGDAAYRGLHQKVIVPFTGALNHDQADFNRRHSSLRQVVERSIGALENQWRILQLKENRLPAKVGVNFASKCLISCSVLHNRFTNYVN